ncbi:MAG: hypothetical protein BWZ01_02693 [Deltaproteobacteria bacterium ADurb.BinA179]|nr:MAG: hypothetical protein BWZ01_02693 [Deltaproteobacteria bacterium ADurb.BinA179]
MMFSAWVFPGMVHGRRPGRRQRSEDLHLFRVGPELARGEALQLLHVVQCAPGVGGHEVVGEKLFFTVLACEAVEEVFESDEALIPGLAHEIEHPHARVLGRDFHLARYVVLHEFFEVALAVFRVRHHQVVANAGGHKGLFHPGQTPDRPQELDLRLVSGLQTRAHSGEQALSDLAGRCRIAAAAHGVHVGRGPSEVRDDAPEFGMANEPLRLSDNGLP